MQGSLPLDVRSWTCESCQTKHDRDINASINIKDEGLRILTRQSPQVGKPAHGAGSSGTGDKACPPDISRSNRGRKKSTTTLSVGQEAYTVLVGEASRREESV